MEKDFDIASFNKALDHAYTILDNYARRPTANRTYMELLALSIAALDMVRQDMDTDEQYFGSGVDKYLLGIFKEVFLGLR